MATSFFFHFEPESDLVVSEHNVLDVILKRYVLTFDEPIETW